MPRPSLLLPALAALLLGCGGSAPPRTRLPLPDDLDAAPARAAAPPSGPRARSLQLYLVLSPDPQAFQGEGAIAELWRTVLQDQLRYGRIRSRVVGAPDDYKLEFQSDFAEPPSKIVSEAQLAELVATLPAAAQAQARAAKVGVLIRADNVVLPQGGQIRLAGLVPLYIADRWGGVIVDLLARRAHTPEAWSQELAGDSLSKIQLRLVTRADEGGTKWLLSRGNPKYGVPDLEMRRIPVEKLDAARSRFLAAQDKLLAGGPASVGETLGTCGGPSPLYDGGCVSLPPPP